MRLRDQVGLWLISASALPLALLAWLYITLEVRNVRSMQAGRVAATAEATAAALDRLLALHLAAIEHLAATMPPADADRDAQIAHLATFHAHYPGLLTLLRTDAEGEVLAVSSGAGSDSDQYFSERRASVADRSYFQVPRSQLQSYISEVFRGRGLGDDFIVALSAPILTGEPPFDGVVQGALRLAAFDEITERILPRALGLTIDVYDHSSRVVYSTGVNPTSTLEQMDDTVAQQVRMDAEGLIWSAEELAAVAVVGNSGWQVLVRLPLRSIQLAQQRLLLSIATALTVGLLLVILATRRAAALVAAPLETIKSDLDQVDLERPDATQLHALPRRAAIEVHAIRAGFVALLQRLAEAGNAQRQALASRDEINANLEAVLAERDAYISRQTADLTRTLAEAQSASLAKDQLLSNTSHEIRTPLNALIGTAELLLHGPLDPGQRQKVETVLQSGEMLLTLINDLLDLSRARQGGLKLQIESLALRGELAVVVEALAALAQENGLTLHAEVADGVPDRIDADPARLRQVLLNLCGNAIKFTEQGGVRIEVTRETGGIRFAVRDSGIGINPEDVNRVFEPFVQADAAANRRFAGSGLGLPIARHLVELMGGTIQLDSEPGRGSCFWFVVPLASVSPVPTPEPEAPVAEPEPLPQQRVLVVDDVDINRELALAQLQTLDLPGEAVDGGQAALDRLLSEPAIDVVLLDCQMPGMDGYTTARLIRALPLEAQPRVIAMTANAQPSERARCLDAGMDDYLSKPLRLKTLRAALSARR